MFSLVDLGCCQVTPLNFFVFLLVELTSGYIAKISLLESEQKVCVVVGGWVRKFIMLTVIVQNFNDEYNLENIQGCTVENF